MTTKAPTSLRKYQEDIVNEVCRKHNAIVLLPTGAGKTLVAAELIRRCFKDVSPEVETARAQRKCDEEEEKQPETTVDLANERPNVATGTTSSDGDRKSTTEAASTTSSKQEEWDITFVDETTQKHVLFLVPQTILVEQQVAALSQWIGHKRTVLGFCGGMQVPDSHYDVLVSTPAAFINAQLEGTLPGWEAFRLVVFDEVHHVLKQHPYRQLALGLRKHAERTHLQNLEKGVSGLNPTADPPFIPEARQQPPAENAHDSADGKPAPYAQAISDGFVFSISEQQFRAFETTEELSNATEELLDQNVLETTPVESQRESLMDGTFVNSFGHIGPSGSDDGAVADRELNPFELPKVISGVPRVLGLTASLTYAVERAAVQQAIRQLCRDLRIHSLEFATIEALQRDGYSATRQEAQVEAFPEHLRPKGVIPPDERKPHAMLETLKHRIEVQRALPLVILLDRLILKIEIFLKEQYKNDGFGCTPREDFQKNVTEWGAVAHQMAIHFDKKKTGQLLNQDIQNLTRLTCFNELPDGTNDKGILRFLFLEHLYEAMRIVCISWEEQCLEAVIFLQMMMRTLPTEKAIEAQAEFKSDAAGKSEILSLVTCWPDSIRKEILAFFQNALLQSREQMEQVPQEEASAEAAPAPVNFASIEEVKDLTHYISHLPIRTPRIDHLKKNLKKQFEERKQKSSTQDFHGIVFVDQRVVANVVTFYIKNDRELNEDFFPVVLHSANTSATPCLRLNKTDNKASLDAFAGKKKAVKCNLLVTTSVGEEGMDIPAANSVIRFDPVINSVSLTQSRGRARQADSSFVVLQERSDRPVTMLQEVEQQQLNIAKHFDCAQMPADNMLGAKQSATDRVRTSIHYLKEPDNYGGVLQSWKSFCDRTQVTPSVEEGPAPSVGGFKCKISYESILYHCTSQGRAGSKKDARKKATETIIASLLAEIGKK